LKEKESKKTAVEGKTVRTKGRKCEKEARGPITALPEPRTVAVQAAVGTERSREKEKQKTTGRGRGEKKGAEKTKAFISKTLGRNPTAIKARQGGKKNGAKRRN